MENDFRILTVLDYEAGGVITHSLTDDELELVMEDGVEALLIENNINPSNCEWMIHKGLFKTGL